MAITTMVIQTCFRTCEAQRSAAVEQNVAGAEQQDDLVQRRIRLDVDQPQRLRADRDADDEKHRDIGNPDLLRQQAGEGADRQNEPARQQRVLGDFNGGRCFQFVFSPRGTNWQRVRHFVMSPFADAARRAVKWQGRSQPGDRDDNMNFVQTAGFIWRPRDTRFSLPGFCHPWSRRLGTDCARRPPQFNAFSQAPISPAATLACCSSLPMVKKPWNWPGNLPVGHGDAGLLQSLRRIRRLRRAGDRRPRSAHRPAAGRSASWRVPARPASRRTSAAPFR